MAERKVIDIFPPKELSKKEAVFIFSRKEKELKKIKGLKEKKPRSFKNILIPGLIILVFIVAYFTLAKAEIEVWPVSETKVFEIKITASTGVQQSDPAYWVNNKVVPGEIFTREKTIAEIFTSSSKALKETKAEGTIRVYNEYSTSPQILIATTRFVSTEGKVFRTPISITVPGGRYEGGKLLPGELDIGVVADQPGPDYNIEPTTFSIPGFAGTPRYTKFYAKSFEPMTGGFAREVFQVTEEDLGKAEEQLTAKAKKESETYLKNELQSEKFSSQFYFLENGIQTEIVEKFSLVQAGEELAEFNFQVKSKSETLVIKKEDLEKFAKEFINSQILEGKKIHEDSLKMEYYPDKIDLGAGKMTFDLKASATVYSEVNVSVFKNHLMGKSLNETKTFLSNQPEIVRTEVKFWPFWVRKIPENTDKIEFRLILD